LGLDPRPRNSATADLGREKHLAPFFPYPMSPPVKNQSGGDLNTGKNPFFPPPRPKVNPAPSSAHLGLPRRNPTALFSVGHGFFFQVAPSHTLHGPPVPRFPGCVEIRASFPLAATLWNPLSPKGSPTECPNSKHVYGHPEIMWHRVPFEFGGNPVPQRSIRPGRFVPPFFVI